MHILKRGIASPTMHPNAHIFLHTKDRERVSEMHHFVLGDFTLFLFMQLEAFE